MLKIHFLVPYCTDTVGVKSPGLKKTFVKLSDTLVHRTQIGSPVLYVPQLHREVHQREAAEAAFQGRPQTVWPTVQILSLHVTSKVAVKPTTENIDWRGTRRKFTLRSDKNTFMIMLHIF